MSLRRVLTFAVVACAVAYACLWWLYAGDAVAALGPFRSLGAAVVGWGRGLVGAA